MGHASGIITVRLSRAARQATIGHPTLKVVHQFLPILVCTLVLAACANAQAREDPCSVPLPKAEYALKKAQQEQQLIASKDWDTMAVLSRARLALAKAERDVSERTPKDLLLARFVAETARMTALSSDSAREIWESVSRACFERLKFPQKEIAAINSRTNRLQTLLDLSPDESNKQFKQGTDDMERDYGKPESAVRTLKSGLSLLQRELKR